MWLKSVKCGHIKHITDWSVTLKTDNDWLFQQSSPYPGSIEDFPDDSIDYNAGKARHEIKSLPTLSKTAVDFDTMSVWLSTNTINICPNLTVNGLHGKQCFGGIFGMAQRTFPLI